jgi:hypothetical protein
MAASTSQAGTPSASAKSSNRQGKDPEAFIRSHRLEALRRAGQWSGSTRIIGASRRTSPSGGWRGGDGVRIRTLSIFDLEPQIGSDGATWLDRELVASTATARHDRVRQGCQASSSTRLSNTNSQEFDSSGIPKTAR